MQQPGKRKKRGFVIAGFILKITSNYMQSFFVFKKFSPLQNLPEAILHLE
jgi:hypothetical protein